MRDLALDTLLFCDNPRMKRAAIFLAIAGIAIAGALAWNLWGTAKTPEGQPGLVWLEPANFTQLQKSFNENDGKVRIVALLSPT